MRNGFEPPKFYMLSYGIIWYHMVDLFYQKWYMVKHFNDFGKTFNVYNIYNV